MHKLVLWIQTVLIPTLGPAGLFFVAFCDSSFLSLPEINDILVVTYCAADPARAWVPISMATLGSLAGCGVLWVIGRRGGEPLLERRFGKAGVERTRAAFERWDLMALIVPALLPPPMPFKIFVLSAGVFGVPWRRFALTLILARGLRYVFWGLLGIFFGDEALALLRAFDHWFDEEGWKVVMALVAAVLVALLVWLVRRRGRSVSTGGASGA
jgi:membrane protein YqaA with SNARE-associated domain